jgi:hypothetical protein
VRNNTGWKVTETYALWTFGHQDLSSCSVVVSGELLLFHPKSRFEQGQASESL